MKIFFRSERDIDSVFSARSGRVSVVWLGMVMTVCALFAGCATPLRFSVKTTRVAEPARLQESYTLSLFGARASTEDAVEVAGICMRAALARNGLYETPTGKPADVVIAVRLGVEP